MKIKFIIHWFHTPHDIYGNSYTYVVITDTRTGRKISSSDVPESNAWHVAFYLNGQAHVHNYYWVESLVTKKQLKWRNPTYVSSDAETLAKAFMKEVRRRKAKPDGENL